MAQHNNVVGLEAAKDSGDDEAGACGPPEGAGELLDTGRDGPSRT